MPSISVALGIRFTILAISLWMANDFIGEQSRLRVTSKCQWYFTLSAYLSLSPPLIPFPPHSALVWFHVLGQVWSRFWCVYGQWPLPHWVATEHLMISVHDKDQFFSQVRDDRNVLSGSSFCVCAFLFVSLTQWKKVPPMEKENSLLWFVAVIFLVLLFCVHL